MPPRHPAARLLRLVAPCLFLAVATGPGFAQADPNVEGGSLGGTFTPAAPAPHASQPRPRPAARAAPPRQRAARHGGGGGVAAFDGAWSVSAGGNCASAGTSQVTISGGRVIGQGGGGHVSPSGVVTTASAFNGMTVVGRGRISGNAASGVYRQSDGCTGPWSAVRL